MISIGRPVFFTQERVTKNGNRFRLYKFRSMTSETDENGGLLPDEQRRTKLGTFLRGSSLDELPEIWNIFMGDMSIIGPRPLYPKYEQYYTDYEKHRNNVRGGLLPPEILYNNPMPTWDEQLKWEADYGVNCSFSLDLKILLKTFSELTQRSNESYGTYTREALDVERESKI